MQVTLGLEYMQYMELVYRDLKPENILINVNGYLKVSPLVTSPLFLIIPYYNRLGNKQFSDRNWPESVNRALLIRCRGRQGKGLAFRITSRNDLGLSVTPL